MIYKEAVCRISKWRNNPCLQTKCKHHFIYLLNLKSELEDENLPKQGKCPYGKKWSEESE